MDQGDWTLLIERIEKGECTPFLGAGVHEGRLPTGAQLALDLAKERADHPYPFKDRSDLLNVAQYLATMYDDFRTPKTGVQAILRRKMAECEAKFTESLASPDNPLKVLADLPLPIYITTNYDDYLLRALQTSAFNGEKKKPAYEVCRWNSERPRRDNFLLGGKSDYKPSVETPLVFHLHGHMDWPDFMVLTEDDYLDFVMHLFREGGLVQTKNQKNTMLPSSIQDALSQSLLFVGYKLADWDFKILFKILTRVVDRSMPLKSIAVQLEPDVADEEQDPDKRGKNVELARRFYEEYFQKRVPGIKIYWGTAGDFAAILRTQREAYVKNSQQRAAAHGQ